MGGIPIQDILYSLILDCLVANIWEFIICKQKAKGKFELW